MLISELFRKLIDSCLKLVKYTFMSKFDGVFYSWYVNDNVLVIKTSWLNVDIQVEKISITFLVHVRRASV